MHTWEFIAGMINMKHGKSFIKIAWILALVYGVGYIILSSILLIIAIKIGFANFISLLTNEQQAAFMITSLTMSLSNFGIIVVIISQKLRQRTNHKAYKDK